ncbi:MAG TPA: glycosyltransferase family 2 protein [Patescibacteria group bacterium]|nr:glycosyltransferase family 2 protein [Patescibacteria group bacterium]
MAKISAIVLVGGRIDEELLKKCLDSISWADEVIKVETKDLPGSFADWRNEGAKRAKGDWLLYVDSDETITPELKKAILKVTNSSEFAAYAIPRRNFIFGKEFKHGGTWPDYWIRLIKKDKLIRWEGDLHEQPKVKGAIFHLKEPVIHNKHKDLSGMVEKTNKWSEIEARLMFEAGHPEMNVIRFASVAAREFWKRMITQTAFLDGTEGIIYAIYQVFSRLISYSKLWEMQIKKKQ